MNAEHDIFNVMHTMRAMRRFKPDPVPDEMIAQILDAGTCAPSGQNTQRWSFLVCTEPSDKKWFGERYDYWMRERLGERIKIINEDSARGRSLKAAMHLSERMSDVPVLLFCCGKRDWPFSVEAADRVGKAPPSYGSIYPCVQNILLACRALGLGASLTTMHQMFEADMRTYFRIPENYGVVAVIPIGFPSGKFGPTSRKPARTKTHFNRWGEAKPGLAEPRIKEL